MLLSCWLPCHSAAGPLCLSCPFLCLEYFFFKDMHGPFPPFYYGFCPLSAPDSKRFSPGFLTSHSTNPCSIPLFIVLFLQTIHWYRKQRIYYLCCSIFLSLVCSTRTEILFSSLLYLQLSEQFLVHQRMH